MGCYDTFKDGDREAQIKALECVMNYYKPGAIIPVTEFEFPLSCTFADWGGSCSKYEAEDLVASLLKSGEKRNFGIFVVIEGGIFSYITEEIDNVIYPVFNKYGVLLDDGAGNDYKTILDDQIEAEQAFLKEEFEREGLDVEED